MSAASGQDMSLLQWTRPANVTFPYVWHRFETPTKDGISYKIRIEDLTVERHADMRQFLYENYLPDDPNFKVSKFRDDPKSVASHFKVIDLFLQQNVSVIAVLDDDNESTASDDKKPQIVAAHVRKVVSKGDKEINESSGEPFTNITNLCQSLVKGFDPCEIFKVDNFIHPWGLCVDRKYRRLNIGYEMFSSMEKMAKVLKIPAAMVLLSAVGSQKIAEKHGFKVYNEIIYQEYKKDGKVVFPVEGVKGIQWAGKKYDI